MSQEITEGGLTERQAFLVLNALPDLGPVALHRLLEEFGGDPRAVLAGEARRLLSVTGVRPTVGPAISRWRERFDLGREEGRMAKSGARFLLREDPEYPGLLREVFDPPIGLYCKGRYDGGMPAVAIVGTRKATLYGQSVAKKLGAELAQRGFCVVSGLARGIDTAAHEGALSVGGKTAAVLGTGIDLIYPPENLALYRRIAETGAIFSEFPFGRAPTRQSFPMRNRVVAGMCGAVVVVESDVHGGAMITARFAGEQGRLLFAVPGRIDQPTSAGCNQLIRDGATLLASVEDILSEMNYLGGLRPAPIGEKPKTGPRSGRETTEAGTGATGEPGAEAGAEEGTGGGESPGPAQPGDRPEGFVAEDRTPARSRPRVRLEEDEARVLECFRGGERPTSDTIAAQTGFGAAAVAVALTMLEIKGLVAKRIDGTYEACP